MSNKDEFYDNAAMDSWNHCFKVEAVRGKRFLTRLVAKYQVFEQIEVYYLCPRLQSQTDLFQIRQY